MVVLKNFYDKIKEKKVLITVTTYGSCKTYEGVVKECLSMLGEGTAIQLDTGVIIKTSAIISVSLL